MKKFVIILIFCLSIFGSGQSMDLIKRQVEVINTSKNYIVKKIPNDYFADVKNEVTDNGQELEGYFKNKELRKIVHSLGLSSTMITTQFYFNKGNLIFVLRKKYQTIDEEGNLSEPKLSSESRFYFVNGKVINKINNNDYKDVAALKQQSIDFQKDLKVYK